MRLNKDFRPDLKQLLWILTVSADGAVPIAYRVADGNTVDDLSHVPTWDELRALVGTPSFLYVADSKLCSQAAMGHIAEHGGRFVTVIPHGRREDTWFGSGTGHKPVPRPGKRPTAVPVHAETTPTRSGEPSRPRHPPPMGTE